MKKKRQNNKETPIFSFIYLSEPENQEMAEAQKVTFNSFQTSILPFVIVTPMWVESRQPLHARHNPMSMQKWFLVHLFKTVGIIKAFLNF